MKLDRTTHVLILVLLVWVFAGGFIPMEPWAVTRWMHAGWAMVGLVGLFVLAWRVRKVLFP